MTDNLPLPEPMIYPDEALDVGLEALPYYTADQLRDYAAAAVAAERERCADICDQHATVEGIAQKCAAEIRGLA